MISISNDGKVWNWLITGECDDDNPKVTLHMKLAANDNGWHILVTNMDNGIAEGYVTVQQPEQVNAIKSSSKPKLIHGDISFKVEHHCSWTKK